MTFIKFTIGFLLAAMAFKSLLFAQSTAGSGATQEARYLYNLPTAGALKRGAYAIEGWAFSSGGVLLSASVGIADKFAFGISYGAGNVIGSGAPSWNRLPGATARYRLLDEDALAPALSLGFDSQGRGNFIDSLNRYERKAAGFFIALSKNFEFLGFLTLHAGVNYSILERQDDANANVYVGLEKTIGADITLYLQYDAALNDDRPSWTRGRGYLDAGARWSVGSGITLELNLTNLNDNQTQLPSFGRNFRLEFVQAL